MSALFWIWVGGAFLGLVCVGWKYHDHLMNSPEVTGAMVASLLWPITVSFVVVIYTITFIVLTPVRSGKWFHSLYCNTMARDGEV